MSEKGKLVLIFFATMTVFCSCTEKVITYEDINKYNFTLTCDIIYVSKAGGILLIPTDCKEEYQVCVEKGDWISINKEGMAVADPNNTGLIRETHLSFKTKRGNALPGSIIVRQSSMNAQLLSVKYDSMIDEPIFQGAQGGQMVLVRDYSIEGQNSYEFENCRSIQFENISGITEIDFRGLGK